MGLFKKVKKQAKKAVKQTGRGLGQAARGNFKQAVPNVIGAGARLTGATQLATLDPTGLIGNVATDKLNEQAAGVFGLKQNSGGAFVNDDDGGSDNPFIADAAPGPEGETPEQARIRKLRQLRAQALLSGRASTVSTSPLGLQEAATTQPRALLGG